MVMMMVVMVGVQVVIILEDNVLICFYQGRCFMDLCFIILRLFFLYGLILVVGGVIEVIQVLFYGVVFFYFIFYSYCVVSYK